MIPRAEDLILKEKVKLYNNLATINDCQGRLSAELEIYPTPRVIWEFEVLGEPKGKFPYGAGWGIDSLDSFTGYSFLIEKPICTGSSSSIGPLEALRGITKQAVFGELQHSANSFIFYLPNTQFHRKRARQSCIIKSLKDSSNNKEVALGEEGRYVASSIDDVWDVRLEIGKAALEWLNPRNENIGTFITTIGQLRQSGFDASNPQTFSNSKVITLHDALKRIKYLCWLFSYANGGYIGPLYIEGYQAPQDESDTRHLSCAIAIESRTTPLERIGHSWLTESSDLNKFLSCFSTFERMMQIPEWEETFSFTLAQYFQAIQPDQVGWAIRASAIGVALERLTYMILVEEETDTQKKDEYKLLFNNQKNGGERRSYQQRWNRSEYQKKDGKQLSQTGIRLVCLLERIGITRYQDADDIQALLNVRNDAVHPISSEMTLERRSQIIEKAIQWIDEVLLWRIGYDGKYLDRSQTWEDSIVPRYDLELRNSDW